MLQETPPGPGSGPAGQHCGGQEAREPRQRLRRQGHVQVGRGPGAGRAKVWDSLSLKGKPPQNGLWRENESREGTSAGHTRPTGLCGTRTCSPGFRTPRRSDCPQPSIPDTAPSARRLRSPGAVSRGHRASSRPHVREVHPPPRPTALWVPATNAEPASSPRHWRPLSTTRASSSPSRHPAGLSAAEGSPERGVGVQPLLRGAPGSRPAALGPCIPGGVGWRLPEALAPPTCGGGCWLRAKRGREPPLPRGKRVRPKELARRRTSLSSSKILIRNENRKYRRSRDSAFCSFAPSRFVCGQLCVTWKC